MMNVERIDSSPLKADASGVAPVEGGSPRPTRKTGFFRLFRHPVLWIVLAVAPFYLFDLSTPAFNDGECMYAEIAREMRLTGDWITPHLNGKRHFDKPPLLYWLIGLGQNVLGETEYAARMWAALATLGAALVVGAIGRSLYGARAAWLSALVFITSLGPHLFGKLAMPDLPLVFCITLAILGYVRGFLIESPASGRWSLLMFVGFGLATLSKGLVGLGLSSAVIGLHAILSGRLRSFLTLRFASGIAVTAAIAVPWYVAAARANPDFLGYFFIREHLMRFTGERFPPDECVALPVFLVLTFVWTFPWLPLVPQALWRAVRRLKAGPFLKGVDLLPLVWIGVVVLLFSASKSRLEYYAMPAIPAFALLLGRLWDDLLEPGPASRRTLATALGVMAGVMVLAAFAAFAVFGPWQEVVFRFYATSWPTSGWIEGPEQAALLDRLRIPSIASMAGLAVFTVAALVAALKSRPKVALGITAVMTAPLFLMIHWGFLVVEPFHSSARTAEIVTRAAGPEDVVVFQEPYEYMWTSGITYYAKRYVHILKDPRFEGVASRLREPPDRFLDGAGLQRLWASGKKVVFVGETTRGDLTDFLNQAGPVTVVGRSAIHYVLCNGK